MVPAELMGLKPNNFRQLNNLVKNKRFINSLISNVSSTLYFLKKKTIPLPELTAPCATTTPLGPPSWTPARPLMAGKQGKPKVSPGSRRAPRLYPALALDIYTGKRTAQYASLPALQIAFAALHQRLLLLSASAKRDRQTVSQFAVASFSTVYRSAASLTVGLVGVFRRSAEAGAR